MSTGTPTDLESGIEYPDSDGQPMSDNTLQFQWIQTIQGNLDALFRHHPLVFVAGDLLWYPVKGKPELRIAPDALVAFGPPKGYRGSYQQWLEGDQPPQVVFEILSPYNRPAEMDAKFDFYERFGVEEYYFYDPYTPDLCGWLRAGESLEPIPELNDWVSPRLGIRFDPSGEELVIFRSDGQRFLTFVELMALQEDTQQTIDLERKARKQIERREEQEQLAKVQECLAKEQERLAKERAEERVRLLSQKLRELGIDPEA